MTIAADFCDSFDLYANTTHLTQRWPTTGAAISTTGGRRGGGALFGSGTTARRTATNGAQPAWLLTAAYYGTGFSAGAVLMALYDGSSPQCDVRTAGTAGAVALTRNGSVLATSADGVLLPNAWNVIEFQANIGSGTSGNIECQINNAVVATASGVNTQATATASANGYLIGALLNGLIDDFHAYYSTTSTRPAYVGDKDIVVLLPVADGDLTQYTPSTGTAHWANVDDAAGWNSDTDYNSTGTDGNRDSYTLATLGAGTVTGVQVFQVTRSDTVAGTGRTFVRIAGTNYDQTPVAVNTTYAMTSTMLETNPATSAAWTVSEVNGTQVGVQKVS